MLRPVACWGIRTTTWRLTTSTTTTLRSRWPIISRRSRSAKVSFREFPDNAAYLRQLSSTVNNIGVLLGKQGQYRDALAMYERAAAYSAEAYQKLPQRIEIGRGLCINLGNVALMQGRLGNQQAALSALQRVVTIYRKTRL